MLIRMAAVGDVGGILGLIRELAGYENLSEACVATEGLLRGHLFGVEGAEKVADAMVAEVDGKLVGYAIYFKTFSTFLARPGIYLEDIFVQPAYRGQGIGKGMLREIAKLAVARGYGRVEWSVLDWNTPSIGFYKKLGAEGMEEWTMYRLTGERLRGVGSS